MSNKYAVIYLFLIRVEGISIEAKLVYISNNILSAAL